MQCKAKLRALLKGKDVAKVRHLASHYTTDAQLFPATKFYKEFRAPEGQDYELVIEGHSSGKFLSVKTDVGTKMLHSSQTLRSSGLNSILIPGGSTATIEFPVESSIAKYTGSFPTGGVRGNLNSYDWDALEPDRHLPT